VVLRSYASGAVVDEAVNQADWNLDRMDGNGRSGATLDTSKTQIFVIEFQWLGVGRCRFGLDIGGDIIFVHEFLNANTNRTSVYMTTPNLPLQYELEVTGTPATATSMKQICCSVISEGGYEIDRGFQFSTNTGITTVAVGTTRQHVLSVRMAGTFNGVVNNSLVLFESTNVMAGNDMLIEVLYNPTLAGTATWAAVGNGSSLERNVNPATTITAVGEVIDSFYIPSINSQTRQSTSRMVSTKLPFNLNIAGVSDILTVAATAFTAQSVASAALTWTEIR
jgi:hypothetical protein